MRNILIIAGLGERYYYDAFASACMEEGIEVYVLDPSRLPLRMSIAIILNQSGSVTDYIEVLKYSEGSLIDTQLQLQDIEAAWYLREDMEQTKIEDSSLEARFARNEARRAILSLLSVLECKWINRKEVIGRISSNKLYQQQVALRCGLIVPPTLISNVPVAVTDFSVKNDGLLLKTLGYMQLDAAGNDFLYSERFSKEELADSPEAIRSSPVFAQQYIEKRFEYRVMVIGEQVLACRIDSQASQMTKTDWRHYDFEKVEHISSELPSVLQNKMRYFMREIDLRYGAIDLIERPDGEFVFLEINPCGQWGWIAHHAGLPIAQAVAQMIKTL